MFFYMNFNAKIKLDLIKTYVLHDIYLHYNNVKK